MSTICESLNGINSKFKQREQCSFSYKHTILCSTHHFPLREFLFELGKCSRTVHICRVLGKNGAHLRARHSKLSFQLIHSPCKTNCNPSSKTDCQCPPCSPKSLKLSFATTPFWSFAYQSLLGPQQARIFPLPKQHV